MAIVVTPLGTASDKVSTDPWTVFSSVTLVNGDSLILVVAHDPAGISAIQWNSKDFTLDQSAVNSGNVTLRIHSLLDVVGATGDVIISWSGTPVAMTATLYKVTGLATSSAFDKGAGASGNGTAASSGATATLAQADELIIGAIGVEDEIDDQTGVWDTGAGQVSGNEQQTGTNGAGDASNISIYSAALIVSATTAMTASNTGMDSIDWAAAIATYKAAAVVDDPPSSVVQAVVRELKLLTY